MKKVLKGILIVLLLIMATVGFMWGKEYMENKEIENIVKSDEAKEVIEKRLKSIDNKALTPEGKIKSYKIDYNKVKKNPMGGKYTTGAGGFSPKLYKLTNELEE